MIVFLMSIFFIKDDSMTGLYPARGKFPSLNPRHIEELNRRVSREEVKQTIFDMGAFKSLGPNDFQPSFFHS